MTSVSSPITERLEMLPEIRVPTAPLAVLGARGARLLAGPLETEGPESLAAHELRLGTLDLDELEPSQLRREIAASGLLGRGGGQFPASRKLDLAVASDRQPIIVVNLSEGEPASRKDRTLAAMRPHLVLDGALVAAKAATAREVVFYLHRSHRESTSAIELAIAERRLDSVEIRVTDAPERYIAGESSAVVSFLEGNGAIPRRRPFPVAASGIGCRPTVVNNTETVANMALIARYGSSWFKEAGSVGSPGSTLITLAGEVATPGVIVEILTPVTVGEVLSTTGGLDRPPRAVLIGGYEGTWLDGEAAWSTPLDRGALTRGGVSLGCGVVAPLSQSSCGIATTARLVSWLARESAGQCGSCVFGLPAIAESMVLIAQGRALTRDVRQLRKIGASLYGRGACGHPSGVVTLVESALDTFDRELKAHLHGAHCRATTMGLPIPRGRA